MAESQYIELHCRSAFSFLRGASLPEQLAEDAPAQGLSAMALLDRDGVYGAPRFFFKAKETGLRAIIGVELTMEDGSILPLLAQNRTGYQNICRITTRAHLRSEKGKAAVWWHELPEYAAGLVALSGDVEGPVARAFTEGRNVAAHGPLQVSLQERGRLIAHATHLLLSADERCAQFTPVERGDQQKSARPLSFGAVAAVVRQGQECGQPGRPALGRQPSEGSEDSPCGRIWQFPESQASRRLDYERSSGRRT